MIASDCTPPETDHADDAPSTASTTDPSTDRTPGTRYSYLISLLGRLEGPVTIDQVTDAVHRWEHERAESDGERTWFDVHEELFLVDLPVLDGIDIIEFDTGRGLVSAPGDQPPERAGSDPQ